MTTKGRLILQANPSAVTSYNSSVADLLDEVSGDLTHLADNAGFITIYTYAAITTSTANTAGAVQGYLSSIAIQQGEFGTAIPQSAVQYYAHESEVDGTFVYPVATQTVYRNDNGTGAQTTTYAYTWREDGGDETNQILSTSVTLPFVGTAQNGSNTAETSVIVNDAYGRPVWYKDAAGFISYTEYDNATGAVVKIIRDVDTSETGDFANKPSGWTTPGVGGLHLITSYQVDALGRTIKQVDPKGNITYTVYNDAAHEVRVYRGWDAVNNLPTGPVELSRGELTGTYTHNSTTYYGTFTEYLTYSVTGNGGDGLQVDGSGRPLGNEQINDSDSGPGFDYETTLQTLSRRLSNAGGQLIKSDQYYDFTGTTYTTNTFELTGADAGNFNRTEYVYDPRGRQARVLDAEGMITRTVYDKLGRVASTWIGTDDTPTDPYELWSPTNNGGDMVQLSEMQYDNGGIGDGNLTRSIQIPGGGLEDRVTDYFYDWRNRTVAVKSGVEVGVDPEEEDEDINRALSYTYYNNLSQVTSIWVYDGDTIVISVVNGIPVEPLGYHSTTLRAVTENFYDDQGRLYESLVNSIDQDDGTYGIYDGIVNQTFHDIRGLTSKTVDRNGNETTFEYDSLGRQTKVTSEDPDGGGSLTGIVNYTVYDANGNVEWSILNPTDYDPEDLADNLYATHYVYETLTDRLWKSFQPDPDGQGSTHTSPVTEYSYDNAGLLYEVKDPLNRITRTEYDRLGRTVKTTLPDPDTGLAEDSDITYQTTYDGLGYVLTSTDALGNVTTYGYNSYHQRISTTLPDPDGVGVLTAPVNTATYSPGGDLLSTTDAMGRVTTYDYDMLGRQVLVTMPDPDGAGADVSSTMAYAYDTLGGILSTTDAMNHVTLSTYDGYHRLQTSMNANGEETSFTYDNNGNRLTLTDAEGNVTTWVYDALNRVSSETNELNKTRNYDYDQLGRLKTLTDRRGWTIEYGYDNLSRVTSETWDSLSTSPVTQYTWSYDAAGQLLTAGSSASRYYEYDYDALGRQTNIEFNVASHSATWSFAQVYNANGLRTQLHMTMSSSTWDADSEYLWSYDNLSRMKTAINNGDLVGVWNYNAASQVTSLKRLVVEDPAYVMTYYSYDQAGRLEELRHEGSSSNLFAGYGYTWDAADRITNIDFLNSHFNGEDVSYTLDDAGQVTDADRAVKDDVWSYDDNGNRIGSQTGYGTSQTYGSTAGTNNQLLNDGIYTYTYDDEGNRLTRTKLVSGSPTGERTNYTWDHRNRLTIVEVKMSPTGSVLKSTYMSYDVFGNLIDQTTTDGSTTSSYFLYDGKQMIGQASTSSWERLWLNGQQPGEVLLISDAVQGNLVPLADHLNTVRDVLRESSGNLVASQHTVYDSFGRVTERWQRFSSIWVKYTGSSIIASAVPNGYTGMWYDATVGMTRHDARWYDAAVGRWISEDPIGFAGGDVNLGRYVGNCVQSYTDPSGLAWSFTSANKALGAIGTASTALDVGTLTGRLWSDDGITIKPGDYHPESFKITGNSIGQESYGELTRAMPEHAPQGYGHKITSSTMIQFVSYVHFRELDAVIPTPFGNAEFAEALGTLTSTSQPIPFTKNFDYIPTFDHNIKMHLDRTRTGFDNHGGHKYKMYIQDAGSVQSNPLYAYETCNFEIQYKWEIYARVLQQISYVATAPVLPSYLPDQVLGWRTQSDWSKLVFITGSGWQNFGVFHA